MQGCINFLGAHVFRRFAHKLQYRLPWHRPPGRMPCKPLSKSVRFRHFHFPC
jgi:hypothetical protein